MPRRLSGRPPHLRTVAAEIPSIKRWLDTFKTGPNYAKICETFNGFCASTKGQPWQAI